MNIFSFLPSLGAYFVAAIAVQTARALRNVSRSRLLEMGKVRAQSVRAEEISENASSASKGIELFAMFLMAIGLVFFYWLGSGIAGTPQLVSLIVLLMWCVISVLIVWFTWGILPAIFGRWMNEAYLLSTWPMWRLIGKLVSPFLIAQKRLRTYFASAKQKDEPQEAEENLEEEIRSIVSAGQLEGLIENDEREMIESVIELGDATVAQIMTPRTEMVSIPVESTWDQVIKFAGASGHTRIPVHNKTKDDIVGILHIKDMLVEMGREIRQRRNLRALVRRPFFVPETKPVNEMLQEFQRGRTHLAIVVDEYGGVSGLVTIEDVLEEIVGEIADEHDDALVDGIKQLDETTFEAIARVHISDVNQRLKLQLPDEESFDTLGGYIFHELGRIPVVGESLERVGTRITVLDANRRRIDRVQIEILPPEAVKEAAAEKQTESTGGSVLNGAKAETGDTPANGSNGSVEKPEAKK